MYIATVESPRDPFLMAKTLVRSIDTETENIMPLYLIMLF